MSLDTRLSEAAAAVLTALEGASIDTAIGLEHLPAEPLLELVRRLGELARAVDSLGAVASGEVGRRVLLDTRFRKVALGGEVGGRAASELMRDLTRLDDGTLTAWRRVGDAIAPRTSLQGEALPSRHEPLAEAVLAGEIPAGHAAIVAGGVDRVAHCADADALAEVERTLTAYASSLTSRELARLVRTLPDRFDQDGAEPREDWLRARSKVTVRELPNGLTRVVAELHPEAAGLWRAAVDARTAPRRTPAFTATPETDDITADTRTLAQRRVDALMGICRDALAHDTGTLAGTAVTMLVTVPLETLQSGQGTAAIAGIDEPISAGTARRLAAQAEIIPVVLGSDSEVLDLGRSARLFSEAQRRALAVRDGGCVWPGCDAPPAWCEVAHLIAWILDGLTDLDNAALMCPAHHHRFDRDGWELRRERGAVSLIPPPWLDPARTPRRAGRARLAAA